ncbi:hypothetical protein LZ32DRAFT_694453 [Colletotrichum eremochloae]|nr:hypothetical protein LZ32DRAFT_694453 [Colletotrichum eremochloae]
MVEEPLDTRNSTDTVLEKVLESFAPQENSINDASWYSQCTGNVLAEWNEEKKAGVTHETRSRIINGLVVDIDGTRFQDSGNIVIEAEDAWGISIGLCKEFCGRDNLDMVTSFNRFASASTNYLLPWLTLVAQLPYETESMQADFISLSIGLGSPLLMTFSLMMTILNKRWIRKKFRYLAQTCGGDMQIRVQNALVIADEAGQAPIRLRQKDGWLARLVVLDANTKWWTKAANSLKSTRRGTTLSLIAQLVMATAAWVLTVTGSLQQKVGDTEEALVLSSGSLWIWLVPVIIGWVMVGTQREEDTVRSALRHANRGIGVKKNEETGIEVVTYNAKGRESPKLADPDTRCVNMAPPPLETNPPVIPASPTEMNQSGIPLLHIQIDQSGTSPPPTETNQPSPVLGMFGVAGCQRQQGPVFNYARSISWLNFADRLYKAFEAAIKRMHEQDDIASQPDKTLDDWIRISADCGLAPDSCNHANGSTDRQQQPKKPLSHELVEYTSLSDMSSEAKSTFLWHVFCSILVALALQWGTTGWAIYIAYETVVKGLGCRSGSYVIYGVLATASCVVMLSSAWISHFTMRGYQNAPFKTGRLQLCGALAVVTRIFGHILLIGNTIWLLAISIFELIGFFDSCYCAGTQLSKGLDHGWILLFKDADALKADAQGAWKTGIGMGFVTTILAVIIFYLASREKPEPQGDDDD